MYVSVKIYVFALVSRKSSSSSHSSLDNLAENGTSGLTADGMNRVSILNIIGEKNQQQQ